MGGGREIALFEGRTAGQTGGMEQLLLFDIDGTLLTAAGAGVAALQRGFADAFREELGFEPGWPEVHLHGSTDGQIARDLLAHAGLEVTEERLARFFGCYPPHLERELAVVAAPQGRLLPGVPELLEALRAEGRRQMSLLTGNIQTAAWMKLRRFGIDGYFTPGAFGDDHHDRNGRRLRVLPEPLQHFPRVEAEPHVDEDVTGEPGDVGAVREGDPGAWVEVENEPVGFAATSGAFELPLGNVDLQRRHLGQPGERRPVVDEGVFVRSAAVLDGATRHPARR